MFTDARCPFLPSASEVVLSNVNLGNDWLCGKRTVVTWELSSLFEEISETKSVLNVERGSGLRLTLVFRTKNRWSGLGDRGTWGARSRYTSRIQGLRRPSFVDTRVSQDKRV